MSRYVGGYILFKPGQTREEIIAATLQAMELETTQIEVLLPREGYAIPLKTELSTEQALVELGYRGGGIRALVGLRPVTYWFEPAAGPESLPNLWVESEPWFKPATGLYPVIDIWVAEFALRSEKTNRPTDEFAERWLRLCEQGGALYGYFSRNEDMTERDYLDERIFPHLHAEDLPHLLKESNGNWLVYLGPELARKWQQEQMPWPTSWSNSPPFEVRELPSGARFIRTSRETFEE